MTPESRMGGAAGAGSAIWSDSASGTSRPRDSHRDVGARSEFNGPKMTRIRDQSEGARLSVVKEGVGASDATKRDAPSLLAQPRTVTASRNPHKELADDLFAVNGVPSRRTTFRSNAGHPTPSHTHQPSKEMSVSRGSSRLDNPTGVHSLTATTSRLRQTDALAQCDRHDHVPSKASTANVRPAPTPCFSRPPSQVNASSSTIHLDKPSPPAPGDLLSPYPHSGGTRAQREAYISSALSLPLDMLAEVSDLPATVPSRKSSRLSGVRLRSLLSQRPSPPGVVPQDSIGRKRDDAGQPPHTATARSVSQFKGEQIHKRLSTAASLEPLKVPQKANGRSSVGNAREAELRQSPLPPPVARVSPTVVVTPPTATAGASLRRAAGQPLPPSTKPPTLASNSALGLATVPSQEVDTQAASNAEVRIRAIRSQDSLQLQRSLPERAVSNDLAEAAPRRALPSFSPRTEQRPAASRKIATTLGLMQDGEVQSLGSQGSRREKRDAQEDGPARSNVAERKPNGDDVRGGKSS